jgi:hypothetical protein|tara:strand:- start:17 stop:319 length:303 start_codon:yes stop_codon:yes gene_type:complete
MFLLPDLKTLEELSIGDTKMRLVETVKKNQYIQLYSSLSKKWNVMYKTNVEQEWIDWKNYASVYNNRHKHKQRVGRSDVLVKPRKAVKRKPKSKAKSRSA